ncbi:hypothetical protein RKD19_003141 [Streptomyces canus]
MDAVAAAADVVDQARAGQGRQMPDRLRLVGGQQRGGRGGAERGPPGQREPAQQPPGLLGLVGVAQPQGAFDGSDRAVRAEIRGELARGAGAEGRARDTQGQGQSGRTAP